MTYNDLDPAVIEMTKAYPSHAPEAILRCLTEEIERQGRATANLPETPAQPISECREQPIQSECADDVALESVTSLILCPSEQVDAVAHVEREQRRLVYRCKDNKRFESRSARILREVAAAHRFPNGVTRVTVNDIKSHARPRWLVRIRQEAMYRLATETALSFPQIGRAMGGRDHTTILYGYRQHAKRNGLPLRKEIT